METGTDMHGRRPGRWRGAGHRRTLAAVAIASTLVLAGCGPELPDTAGSGSAPGSAPGSEEGGADVGTVRDARDGESSADARDPEAGVPGTDDRGEDSEPPPAPDDTAAGRSGDAAVDPGDLDHLEIEHHDLSEQFGDLNGVFVLHDVGSTTLLVHGADAADERYQPASTFKIANALIALETGVVHGVDEVRERDPDLAPEMAWWPDVWLQPHSIETGFQPSTLWLFQALARDIGPDRMARWLSDLDYGNAQIGGGIDRFWIDGDLRISAAEQVGFLRRLLADDLPASATNQQHVRDLMHLDDGPGWALHGKTGWTGHLDEYDGMGVGWIVGWVETDDTRWAFATRLDVERGTDLQERERITRDSLIRLGVLPRDST